MYQNVFIFPFFSKKQIQKYQLKKIKKIKAFAKTHTLFYSKIYSNSSIDKINTFSDFSDQTPYVSRVELQKNEKNIVTKNIKTFSKESTSGTTGKSFTMYFGRKYYNYLQLVYLRNFMQLNLKIFSKTSYQWFEPIPNRKKYHDFGVMNKIYFDQLTPIPKLYLDLKKERSNYLALYSCTLILLMNFIEEQKLQKLNFDKIIVFGNILSKGFRQKLEEFFNTEVIDLYGLAEFKDVAYECKTCGNYHLNSDILYPEYIPYDLKNNIYELVLTGLMENSIPLIRYKTGDLVIKTKNEFCDCNNFDLFKDIVGRKGDVIRFNNKIYYPKEICDFLLNRINLTIFRLTQMNKTNLELIIPSSQELSERQKSKIKKYFLGFKIKIVGKDLTYNKKENAKIIFSSRGKFKFVNGIFNKE